MIFGTILSTTYFFSSLFFLIHVLKPVFLPLYVVEGGIYRAYQHQNKFKTMKSLLKMPVFIVVLKVVRFFRGPKAGKPGEVVRVLKMPFGKFSGLDLANIPGDYLSWLMTSDEARSPPWIRGGSSQFG